MSGPVIIRLQNLPLEARSMDIRRFFEGLLIPDGGVHIIGGDRGDAFIAFQSDEDARQAMGRDMHPLCGAQIKLYLSSKTEMQNVIASARQAPPTTTPAPSTFNKSAPVSSNPLDFLSKYVNGSAAQPVPSKKPEINVNAISQLTNNITPNILDQLKNINNFLPGLQTSLPPPKPAVEAPKPNVSIDQILNILQSHLQPGQTAAPSTQEPKKQQLSPVQSYNHSMANGGFNEDVNSYKAKYENMRNGSYNENQNKYNKNSEPSNNYQTNKRNSYNESERKPWSKDNNRDDDSRNPKYVPNYQTTANNANESTNPQAAAQRPPLEPIIRVKNFNTNCSYKDVRTFLQGIQIEHDGIKLLADYNNQRNGSAFVKLISITDLKKALCRNKQFYEDKNIIVTQSSDNEFNTATNVYSFGPNNNTHNNNRSNNNNQPPVKPYEKKPFNMTKLPEKAPLIQQNDASLSDNGFYLKIYGLPVHFDESELKIMFNNVNFMRVTTAAPTPITSTNINNGVEETTTALKAKKLCQVDTQLDLERALTRQDERVGKSKLQIYQISKQEYDREISHAQRHGGRDNTSDRVNRFNNNNPKKTLLKSDMFEKNSDDLYVHMSSVPFSAREADVRDFYEDINVIGVLMIRDSYSQKPTGEVCCHFATKYDCDRALDKHDHLFNNRNVKIRPLSFGEYHQLAQKQLELQRPNGNGFKRKTLLGDAPAALGRTTLLPTPAHSDEQPKLMNFNSNSSQNSNEDDEDLYNNSNNRYNNNRNNHNQKRNYNNNGPVSLMNQNNNQYQNNKRKNYNDNNNSYSNGNNGNNQYNNKRTKPYNNRNEDSGASPNPALPPLPVEFQRYRHRLILLSNIAYDASREDILDLVSTFSALEHTLKIRHDDQGKPAGDAVIAFQTSDDANQAVNQLDGYRFMGDNVKATLFSS